MNAPERLLLPDIQATPDDRVIAFTVAPEDFESIHNHSAYALIRRDKRQPA